MKKLTKAERRAVCEALSAKTFDEALHLTPASVLERLLELPGSDETHDLFDVDMFPGGLSQTTRFRSIKYPAGQEGF